MGGPTMGTSWSVKFVDDGAVAADLGALVQAELDMVIGQMSTWRDSSDLSRFNTAPAGSWHELPEALFVVLEQALNVAHDSGGAYDPTVGPLVNLWGFGPQGAYRRPSGADVAAQRSRVGWHRIELDPPRRRARQPGGAYVDLSGIAKGYAVDAVARCLRRAGVAGYLVEIGGELYGHGAKPDGQPWWVELEQPQAGAGEAPLPVTRVALHGLAVATSGDYRRYMSDGLGVYSHTIDPRTGAPIENGVTSVTVLHPECMVADAMATALTVMGPEAGLAWAVRRGLAASIVWRAAEGHREAMTPNFAAMME
ncbi:thiamine biosynthesis protein ApbE [Pigmentiphaga sp. NML080357]|uniref:FAD:protein FMN transferase n=1 Tax=Pigmentiphaga sp. NML080357 TaxID=2008675 RepID=UPI000B4158EC|nr:FAD:protein FMN transferase [Pigmentiphaga sp. NML080357]OVZ55916.1 thiamine biosynthesis protein ApbE [Pigmentiphaga sp. NML080357]